MLFPLFVLVSMCSHSHCSSDRALSLCLAESDRGWLPHLVEIVVSEAVPDHVRAALASLLPPLADQVRGVRGCTGSPQGCSGLPPEALSVGYEYGGAVWCRKGGGGGGCKLCG